MEEARPEEEGNADPVGTSVDRALLLARRHAAIDRMLALRDRAIADGMELWDEERLQEEIASMRSKRVSSD